MSQGGFEQVTRTHVGCRRKLNEDAAFADPAAGLWAVADGMGGHDAGEFASMSVIEALAAADASGTPTMRADRLVAALGDVNDRLIALARAGDEQRTIGSTVVALIADENEFTCIWVGDSRAYRLRGGVLAQLTRDHSLVQELVDAGMLDAAEADGHPNANIITRAVGAAELLEVDRLAGDLRTGDVFLLASDGVTRLLSVAELTEQLGSADLEAAADRIIATVLDRDAPDNATLILVRVA